MPLPANFFRVPMIVINGLPRFVEVKMVTPALILICYTYALLEFSEWEVKVF